MTQKEMKDKIASLEHTAEGWRKEAHIWEAKAKDLESEVIQLRNAIVQYFVESWGQ